MKSIIRLSAAFILIIVVASSCTKTGVVYNNPLAGSWVLSDAAEGDAHGWYGLNTGIESGVFRIYNDGTVAYNDRSFDMRGTWYTQTTNGGYYDQYGNYYSNPHQSLEMHLTDGYSHSTLDLLFDDVEMHGNYFIGTSYSGGRIQKYTFSKY